MMLVDDFSETRQIKDRVECHRFALRLDRARAVRFAPDDFSVTRDENDCARQLFLLDRSANNRVHPCKAFGGNALGCGKRVRKLSEERLRNQQRNDDRGPKVAMHFSGRLSSEFQCREDTIREAKSANDP
jgi:hypothetical protein